MKKTERISLAIVLMLTVGVAVSGADWKPVEGHIMTKWAKDVSPDNALPEYPRPMLQRRAWMNLNGLWDYAIVDKDAAQPKEFDGQILVPYPCESALSGVNKTVGETKALWYSRTVEVPEEWAGKRVLLNFGAVDWETTVWVNDKTVGSHKGGYDPFSFDVTDALEASGPQRIVLSVWDPTNTGKQPRGKQVARPGGIWYTAVTGIWQTVWMEPVNETRIESVEITPDVDAGEVVIKVNAIGDIDEFSATATAEGFTGEAVVAGSNTLKIKVLDAKLWTPDSPHLYNLRIVAKKDGKIVDRARSYFGMRKIALGKDENGVTRMMLNGEPLFQYGPLDQGWWPDGLYTAPTDDALRYDIEVTKELGFNMLRKHVKVEPARFYYWCDKLGILVWQDMPSGDKSTGRSGADITRADDSATQFETELKAMIDAFRNYPSIIMWVPFNEGWGQSDTPRIVQLIKDYDPTRLVNNASGWTDRGVGDVHDVHSYPGPAMAPLSEKRASVLGEFGGLGLPMPGHTWQDEKNWGYRSFETREALTDAYVALLARLHMLIGKGLCAAVYTQTTDVEVEVNGLLPYDRAFVKMDVQRATEAAKRLHLPGPTLKTIVPTSQEKAQTWRYTMTKPAEGWEKSDFDDSSWKEGKGGFGTRMTPGAVVGTVWDSENIWIRRSFEAPEGEFVAPGLMIHHDEDAEVFLNGVAIAKLTGYTSDYTESPLGPKAVKELKPGANVLAIHCRQTQGGQFIDAGFVDIVPAEKK